MADLPVRHEKLLASLERQFAELESCRGDAVAYRDAASRVSCTVEDLCALLEVNEFDIEWLKHSQTRLISAQRFAAQAEAMRSGRITRASQ
jgi:hypothetical protein